MAPHSFSGRHGLTWNHTGAREHYHSAPRDPARPATAKRASVAAVKSSSSGLSLVCDLETWLDLDLEESAMVLSSVCRRKSSAFVPNHSTRRK